VTVGQVVEQVIGRHDVMVRVTGLASPAGFSAFAP